MFQSVYDKEYCIDHLKSFLYVERDEIISVLTLLVNCPVVKVSSVLKERAEVITNV